MPENANSRKRKPFFFSGETLVAVGFFAWSASILLMLAGLIFLVSAPRLTDAHWNRLSLFLAIGLMLAFASNVFLILGAIRWGLASSVLPQLEVLKARLAERDQALEALVQHLGHSDVARRLASRDADRAVLRQAIADDIAKRDFESAMALVGQLEQLYGYHQEAEQFRDQIAAARRAEREAQVAAAIARFDDILQRREWDHAMGEAEKLQRLYPDSQRVRGLDKRVRDAREGRKQELEREFLAAAQRDDVDRAMELLKELDGYLSSAEAEPFRETARGVIGKKRDNLGVQFKLAVHDKEWTQAVRVGEQIIREFPNTRMADEVRGHLDKLRAMAAGQQAARGPGAGI